LLFYNMVSIGCVQRFAFQAFHCWHFAEYRVGVFLTANALNTHAPEPVILASP
jgi:hypothetical protein